MDYYDLAVAVIKQACIDYYHILQPCTTPKRRYYKDFKRWETDNEYYNRCLTYARIKISERKELKTWFLSQDFKIFSENIDGEALSNEIERKVECGEKLHFKRI